MSSSTVKSAERTLDVLRLLAASLRPVPTMTIARTCNIPKSSTHHLLNVMLERDWVTYFPEDRGWGLGLAAYETGSSYLRSQPLQRLARPILQRLAAATALPSHLAVLHGDEVLYLDKAAVREEVPLVTSAGVRLPAHLTAVGRALLAALTRDQVRALYVRPVLVKRTQRGPVTVGGLLSELDEVRKHGYSVEVGLTTPGIGCVAAVARSHEGYPTAAFGVTFVGAEHDAESLAALGEQVQAAADALAAATGVRRRLQLAG